MGGFKSLESSGHAGELGGSGILLGDVKFQVRVCVRVVGAEGLELCDQACSAPAACAGSTLCCGIAVSACSLTHVCIRQVSLATAVVAADAARGQQREGHDSHHEQHGDRWRNPVQAGPPLSLHAVALVADDGVVF